jgi:hypothetical protein
MLCDRMRDLVRHHRRQPVFVLRHRQDAGVNRYLAPRQTPRVPLLRSHQCELPLEARVIRHSRDSLPDSLHHLRLRSIAHDLAARLRKQLAVSVGAQLRLIFFGKRHPLAAARHRHRLFFGPAVEKHRERAQPDEEHPGQPDFGVATLRMQYSRPWALGGVHPQMVASAPGRHG